MFRNNNLSVCWRLVRREFRFHKGRNLMAVLSVALTMALFTVLSVIIQSLVGSNAKSSNNNVEKGACPLPILTVGFRIYR